MSHDNVIVQRYRIETLLGEGGMGQVFRAYDQTLGRPVAVKLLTKTASDQAMKRFHQEAKALAALKHPNIMPVYDFGQADDGRLFLVLKLIEGQSLSDIIEKHGAQPFLEVLPTLEKICDALRFAHGKKILHRDVKPSNVLLAADGTKAVRVLLSDFGLSKQIEKDLDLTKVGTTMGTPAYMSPEAVLGKDTDERSDIYSLGCLIFEVLSGKTVFQGETVLSTMTKQVNQAPPALSEVCPFPVAPELDAFLARCLAKEPKERFGSVDELIDEMGRIKSQMEGKFPGVLASGNWKRLDANFGRTTSRTPYIVAAITVAVLIGAPYVTRLFVPENRSLDAVPQKKIKLKSQAPEKMPVESRGPGVYAIGYEDNKAAFYPLILGRLSDTEVENGLAKFPQHIGRVAFEKAQVSDAILNRLLVNEKLQYASFFDTPATISDKTFRYLTEARNLVVLSIEQCGALAPHSLRKLARLKKLQMVEVDLKDSSADAVEAISEINSIFRLRLQNWHLTERDVSALARLSNLRRLDLKSCTVTPEVLSQLKQVPQCNSIGFHNMSLSEQQLETISRLPGLASLTLDITPISDKAFLKLINARSLRILEVGKTGVSQGSAQLLRKLLPKLQHFTFNVTEDDSIEDPDRI